MAAHKRKKHIMAAAAASAAAAAEENSRNQIPKSIVFRSGKLSSGGSLDELKLNIRKMMEPHTAIKLRERRGAKLRDYTAMAGPLGVSHFVILSQSLLSMSLRTTHTPRGPSFIFRVVGYTLMRDLVNASAKPISPGSEYKTSPLVILNGFSGNKSLELLGTYFQNMFPTISLSAKSLRETRRALLFHYDATTDLIHVRHYKIVVDAPEKDAEEAAHEGKASKKAVTLLETGPRLSLSLLKIQSGFFDGATLYRRGNESDPKDGASKDEQESDSETLE